MTCIVAYNDKENKTFHIAADSQLTDEEKSDSWAMPYNFKKFRKINGFIVGCTGDVGQSYVIYDWMEENLETVTYANLKSGKVAKELKEYVENSLDKADFNLLLMKEGRMWILTDERESLEVDNDFCALGNGIQVAMGALAMSQNAKKRPKKWLLDVLDVVAIYNIYVSAPMNYMKVKYD